jgi:dihydroflavonol-4-reductase
VSQVFLTGSTGMIGSNIAEQLVEQGDDVRALVRGGSDATPLEAMGVEIVRGDITDADDVLRAADGCEYVIHSAAVLGGQTQVPGEHHAVNVVGTGHVLDAAAKVGATRVVQLSTTTFFDAQDAPLTEHSPLDPNPSDDPYTVTKRAAYLDAMRRVEEDGQDICIVISGGAYGVSPLPERSMVAPSYNARIALALAGEITEYVGFPIPWVYAGDVARASVVATRKGAAGERYLAFGRPGDVGGVPWFCNTALEVAGSDKRVAEVAVAELDDPDVAARFGPSLVALARKHFPRRSS